MNTSSTTHVGAARARETVFPVFGGDKPKLLDEKSQPTDSDEDFSAVAGWKFRNTNQGVEFRPLKYTSGDFDSLSTQANELTDIVNRLNGCVQAREQP
jgi:hypothetical protein